MHICRYLVSSRCVADSCKVRISSRDEYEYSTVFICLDSRQILAQVISMVLVVEVVQMYCTIPRCIVAYNYCALQRTKKY